MKRCDYNMYYNVTKNLLPKPIATPLIAMTPNKSDFVAIKMYCHKYDPITTLSLLQYTRFLVVELGAYLGIGWCRTFSFHIPTSGLLGFIILFRRPSDTITFFPLVVPAWSLHTRIFFYSKLTMFMGNGSTSSFIRPLSPSVNWPSFKANCTCRQK
jgi:hypothetical protein